METFITYRFLTKALSGTRPLDSPLTLDCYALREIEDKMAESIIIHYSGSSKEQIGSIFDEVSEKTSNTWMCPNNESYKIMIYPYESYLLEYEDTDKISVEKAFGSIPEVSFCFELRRSCQNQACDLAKQIIVDLMSPFSFLVDDCIGKIWLKNEIIQYKGDFLKQYYVKTHNK